MKNRLKGLLIYLLIGLVLITVYLLTPDINDFTNQDRSYHQQAVVLGEQVAAETWHDFRISQIPIAYRKGEREYLVTDGEIEEREPALPVMAATAYPVNGRLQAFVPGRREMDRIGSLVEGVGKGSVENNIIQQFSFEQGQQLSDSFYLATIIHESFHVYQMERWDFEQLFTHFYKGSLKGEVEDKYQDQLMGLTANQQIYNLYQKEANLLYKAYRTDNQDEMVNYLEHFFITRVTRREMMKSILAEGYQLAVTYEQVYELIEGTPSYLMFKSFQMKGDQKLADRYLARLDNLEKDRNRFYTLGMGICLVLEKWTDDSWYSRLFHPNKQPISLEQLLRRTINDQSDFDR